MKANTMVSKCVNPYCNQPFRYLGRGKLFVTEFPPALVAGTALHTRNREHFWLCEECARIMTVAVRREHGGIAIRIINLPPNGGRKLDFHPETDKPVSETVVTRKFPGFTQSLVDAIAG